jgi:hypothetical protein
LRLGGISRAARLSASTSLKLFDRLVEGCMQGAGTWHQMPWMIRHSHSAKVWLLRGRQGPPGRPVIVLHSGGPDVPLRIYRKHIAASSSGRGDGQPGSIELWHIASPLVPAGSPWTRFRPLAARVVVERQQNAPVSPAESLRVCPRFDTKSTALLHCATS